MNNDEVHAATGERRSGFLQPHDVQQFAQLHGLHGLVRVASRRRLWIIGSIVLCMVLALIVTAMTKPVYESTATIELNKSSGGSMDVGISGILSQQMGSDIDSLLIDQQTETAILQGDSLALEVIHRLGLASRQPFQSNDAKAAAASEDSPETQTRLLGVFKGGLRVNPIRGTRLIQVAYDSHDPRQAAQIANAIIESYKDQYLQSHYNATSEASDWLTRQLAELKSNVEESEKKLTDFEKETGIISLSLMPTGAESGGGGGQIHSVVIEKLDALNSELTMAEANRIEKEAIYHLVQTGNSDVIVGLENDPLAVQSKSMVLTQGGGVSNLQQLQQQENELKVNIAQASTTFGANNRHLKEMQTQLHALQEQIHLELQRIVQRAQADFQLAQQTESGIRRRFDDQQASASRLNEKTVQFAVLSQEAYSRKKLYEDLFTKLQEANVSAGLKATNITVVNPARPQSRPVRPKRLTNLAMGMFLGVFFGLSAAFAAESLDRTVSDPVEVEEITGRPVIGVVPSFGEKGRTYGTRLAYETRRRLKENPKPPTEGTSGLNPVWMIEHPASAAAEGFRGLRTSIMLSRGGGGPRVILVTSCIPGEGKTTVASNLAVAFAQHNKRVIVVEADMRRPKLKRKMDFPGEIGLSNVLTGSASTDEAILRGLYVPTLDVLPAGPRPPMPSEILGSPVFDELLEQLRSRYDVIFIDSPPALLVTDAVSISSKADAVIWVSQAGAVTRPQLTRATHIIERNRMPVIGFVVNRLTKTLGGYEYGYEYDAYDTYGEEESQDA